MSRKWERMVERNQKAVNRGRVKNGRSMIADAGRETVETLKGRSWLLPFCLILIAGFYLGSTSTVMTLKPIDYYTAGGYAVMSLFLFWIRRPTLRIGRKTISSIRFSGEKQLAPEDIEEIQISSQTVVIVLKSKKARWSFSRKMNFFPVDKAAELLKEYAVRNQVKVSVN